MFANAQQIDEGRHNLEVAALLQLAALLGIRVTVLGRRDSGESDGPVLFAVLPLRSTDEGSVGVPLDHEVCEAARMARIGCQTRNWFVVYSPCERFYRDYFADPKTGLLFVAGPADLLRICTTTLHLLTVPQIKNIRTKGACSKAVHLKHRLKSGSYTGAVRNEIQAFCQNCISLQLLIAPPDVADKATANRTLDDILKNCNGLSNA